QLVACNCLLGLKMSDNIIEFLKKRRTQYALGKKLPLSEEKTVKLIQDAIKHAPSSFNSQSSRAVILFGAQSEKLWNIVREELRKIVQQMILLRLTLRSMVLLQVRARSCFLKIRKWLKIYKNNFHFMLTISRFSQNNPAEWR